MALTQNFRHKNLNIWNWIDLLFHSPHSHYNLELESRAYRSVKTTFHNVKSLYQFQIFKFKIWHTDGWASDINHLCAPTQATLISTEIFLACSKWSRLLDLHMHFVLPWAIVRSSAFSKVRLLNSSNFPVVPQDKLCGPHQVLI